MADSKGTSVDEQEKHEEEEPAFVKRLSETFHRTSTMSCTLTRVISQHRLEYGVLSIQNTRNEMEDAHQAVIGTDQHGSEAVPEQLADVAIGLGRFSYFAVFDGHGGTQAAEFCEQRLCKIIAGDARSLCTDPAIALQRAILEVEEEWFAKARAEELFDGTTAAVALVDQSLKRCCIGNVGDTEVVLCTQDAAGLKTYRVLTELHNLKQNEAEAKRIAAVGGRVWHSRLGHPKLNPRVCSLAISRSIGDIFFKDPEYTEGAPSGLVAEPYMNSAEWGDQDTSHDILIIGCDGLWDTVHYQMATDLACEKRSAGLSAQTVSEELAKLAQETGSTDNITVMVVFL